MWQSFTAIGRRIAEGTWRKENKKVQQSWQTSALAMHLPLARLVSMPVIFCLLPSSSIIILVFTYLLHTSVNSMCENCDWVWTQFTGLTLPLWGTPVNNTYMSPVQWGLHFLQLTLTVYTYSSVNFRTVFSENQNANPLDADLEPDFKAKWPFKVIQGHPFRCQWKATKGLHSTI